MISLSVLYDFFLIAFIDLVKALKPI